jgi:hypothetical protein
MAPTPAHDTNEPPASSASSLTAEREFQKAVQPSSLISALLSSARQPLVIAPAGGVGPARGGSRKLQAATAKKEGVKSPAKTLKATSRPQGVTEEGGAA